MKKNNLMLPRHGGCLNQAIKKYAAEPDCPDKAHWLDLSTGVNPNGWHVPVIPATVYNRLPENNDGLIEAAEAYYQTKNILPVSGSQEAIQFLPVIFYQHHLLPKNARIGIIAPCYAEHEFHWKKNHFSIIHLTSETVDEVIDELDVLVVINPNNPTGEMISEQKMRAWQARLYQKNIKSANQKKAYLIVDEAFMDSTPENSVSGKGAMDNLIVLRSVGKFFGLAGVRCGFVIAHPSILSLFEYHQGPWSVSGPTRWLVKKVLGDKEWIENNKVFLKNASIRLESLLISYLTKYLTKDEITDKMLDFATGTISGTALFKTLYVKNASILFEQLAKRGVLVRLLDKTCSCQSCLLQYNAEKVPHKGLRFGLPANEKQWQRLEWVLNDIS